MSLSLRRHKAPRRPAPPAARPRRSAGGPANGAGVTLAESESQRLAHVGSWQWDALRNVVAWSAELYRIYGLRADEFSGTYEGFLRLVHPDDRALTRDVIAAAFRDAKPFNYDHRIIRSDGAVRMLQTRGDVVRGPDGAVVRLVGCCMDVTERELDREKLKTLAAGLENRVRERTADLNEKVAELARSNADLEIFAAAASHDLRAPLHKILMYSELLREQYAGKPGFEDFSKLERIGKAAANMNKLIDDVLALSRATREPLPIEDVDLNAALANVLSDLEHVLSASGGTVESGPLPSVRGHRSLWRRLLQNLIANAVKFRAPDRPPRVLIRSEATPDGGALISVEDNGIGFDPAFARKIFLPFQRLHPASAYEGSGLGLSICERIARRYGGDMYARSEPGRGSTFFVRLPASACRR